MTVEIASIEVVRARAVVDGKNDHVVIYRTSYAEGFQKPRLLSGEKYEDTVAQARQLSEKLAVPLTTVNQL